MRRQTRKYQQLVHIASREPKCPSALSPLYLTLLYKFPYMHNITSKNQQRKQVASILNKPYYNRSTNPALKRHRYASEPNRKRKKTVTQRNQADNRFTKPSTSPAAHDAHARQKRTVTQRHRLANPTESYSCISLFQQTTSKGITRGTLMHSNLRYRALTTTTRIL